MTNEELNVKLEELQKNAEVAAALEKAESVDEARAILAENGIELTDDQFDQIITAAKNKAEEGELSEDDMDNVAGGIGFLAACGIAWAVGTIAGIYISESNMKKKKK